MRGFPTLIHIDSYLANIKKQKLGLNKVIDPMD